jgi:hypothetical protein
MTLLFVVEFNASQQKLSPPLLFRWQGSEEHVGRCSIYGSCLSCPALDDADMQR